AKSDGTGKATAIAHNTSTSDSLIANNGKARAVARNNSFSEAEAHADCEAKSNARHDGEAITFCFKDAPGSRGKGKKPAITSRAIGRLGGAAESESDEDCTSFSRAIGSNSSANALCSKAGGVAKAWATDRGLAEASDTDPPDCDISGGGHARVESSAGNCNK